MRKIESEFCKCSHFLNTILMNSVKRGSFPHCKLCTFAHSMTFQFTVCLVWVNTVYMLSSNMMHVRTYIHLCGVHFVVLML